MLELNDRFPELRHLDPTTRSKLIDQCNRRVEEHLRFMELRIGVTITIGVPLLVWIGSTSWFRELGGLGFALVFATFMVFIFHTLRLLRRDEREVLRQVLVTQNIRPAQCFRCRYDLQGSVSQTCPECGIELEQAKAQA